MRFELIIAFYCIVSLFPLTARWIFHLDTNWLWFINDMSYGLRVVALSLPVFLGIKKRARDWTDYGLLFLFGLLLFSNITTILNDYKFVDLYDWILARPRMIVTIIVLVFSFYQLKKE